MSQRPWTEIAQRKREARAKLVEPYLGCINGERKSYAEICEIAEIKDLTTHYATGTLHVREVIGAYARRAAEAHQQTNCLTEVLFGEAITQAGKLDQYFVQYGKLIGPLHGVPITLKDQFDVEGVDSTIGYTSRAFRPATEDAVLVQILKGLGAIILAKTNLPQSIMWCETENPMWGLTTNPLNSAFTPGGSSGGEGVLLALHASMVGWGTDIGGSIRIPSHMNGLYGLKPTSTRLPYQGLPVSTEGQEHVPSSVGPMTRSLSSLIAVMQLVLSQSLWTMDPRVTPIPWRQDIFEEVQSRPLTIGVLFDDGVVRVHPPVERLLKELTERLVHAGHEMVPWDNSGHKECIEIMDLFYTADGGEDIRREVEASGEPFIPHVENLISRGPAISVYEYWQLNKRKLVQQKAYNAKWNSIRGLRSGNNVDVILMPTMPHAAVPHRSCRWVGYTKVWNFLDYTALSVPAGKVDQSIDGVVPEYEPRNEYDAWNWNLYDPQTMDGHPVGLQIVGRRFEEEKVLGVTKLIEKIMAV